MYGNVRRAVSAFPFRHRFIGVIDFVGDLLLRKTRVFAVDDKIARDNVLQLFHRLYFTIIIRILQVKCVIIHHSTVSRVGFRNSTAAKNTVDARDDTVGECGRGFGV